MQALLEANYVSYGDLEKIKASSKKASEIFKSAQQEYGQVGPLAKDFEKVRRAAEIAANLTVQNSGEGALIRPPEWGLFLIQRAMDRLEIRKAMFEYSQIASEFNVISQQLAKAQMNSEDDARFIKNQALLEKVSHDLANNLSHFDLRVTNEATVVQMQTYEWPTSIEQGYIDRIKRDVAADLELAHELLMETQSIMRHFLKDEMAQKHENAVPHTPEKDTKAEGIFQRLSQTFSSLSLRSQSRLSQPERRESASGSELPQETVSQRNFATVLGGSGSPSMGGYDSLSDDSLEDDSDAEKLSNSMSRPDSKNI